MVDLALAADGDFDVGGAVTSGADTVSQRVRLAVLLMLGEWYQDQAAGLPWHRRVLGQPDGPHIDALVRATAESVPGVLEVLRVAHTFDRETRQVTAVLDIRTADGADTVSAVV